MRGPALRFLATTPVLAPRLDSSRPTALYRGYHSASSPSTSSGQRPFKQGDDFSALQGLAPRPAVPRPGEQVRRPAKPKPTSITPGQPKAHLRNGIEDAEPAATPKPGPHPALLAELQAALRLPSTSTKPARPDVKAIVSAVKPFLHVSRSIQLEPYLDEIFFALQDCATREYVARAQTPSEVKQMAEVLLHLWLQAFLRFNTSQGISVPTGLTPDAAAELFASYLIRRALHDVEDKSRTSSNLHILEAGIERFLNYTITSRLPAPVVGAWAVLRCRTGQREMPSKFVVVWPERETVVQYLSQILLPLPIKDPTASERKYYNEVDVLLASRQKKGVVLPSTPRELDTRLTELRNPRDLDERVALWVRFKDLSTEQSGDGERSIGSSLKDKAAQRVTAGPPQRVLESVQVGSKMTPLSSGATQMGTTSMEGSSGSTLHPDSRHQVLVSFLRTFTSPGTRRRDNEALLDGCIAEILARLPRPLPREVLHLQLARRARLDESSEDEMPAQAEGQDLRSLDQRAMLVEATRRPVAGRELQAAWDATASAEGGRDVRMYMLYIEGLGRMGDAERMQEVWNELVADEQCRLNFEREEHGSNYPPVKALNQMISSALLVPKTGPAVALNLFEQVIKPDSSISPNVVTVNVILRHHARMADVPAMRSLFALAGDLGLTPDIITYTTLIQGLLRAGHSAQAKSVLRSMNAKGIEATERMLSMLVADLAKSGDATGLLRAEEMMFEMKRREMAVGVVTWTALISGYFRGGWDRDGWKAARRMTETGVKLNRVGYNMIMREAGEGMSTDLKARKKSVAYGFLERMIEEGVAPNGDTFVILLGPMVRARRWTEADQVIRHMKQLRFEPEKANLRGLLKRVRLRRSEK